MSRHPNRCRDIVSPAHNAAHRCPCRDLTMMSRHQACSAPLLLRRDAILPCRDVLCSHPCRDLKHDVATSTPTCCYSARLHPMSRHRLHVATSQTDVYVATSNSMSRHQAILATAAHVAAHVATSHLMSRHQCWKLAVAIPVSALPLFFFFFSSSSLSSCYFFDAVA